MDANTRFDRMGMHADNRKMSWKSIPVAAWFLVVLSIERSVIASDASQGKSGEEISCSPRTPKLADAHSDVELRVAAPAPEPPVNNGAARAWMSAGPRQMPEQSPSRVRSSAALHQQG
jgi:hypothetical protein